MTVQTSVPFRPVTLAPVQTALERRADGTILLRSLAALDGYPARATERLLHWAEHTPTRTFLAQRGADGKWLTLSYAEAKRRVLALTQALLNRGLNADRPLVVLSENSLSHALIGLAAMHVGIPWVPISPPYSLLSSDFLRLRGAFSRVSPGLVFAENARYARALNEVIVPAGIEVVVADSGGVGLEHTTLHRLLDTPVTPAVEAAHLAVTPDTVAKILFTSGSTGHPKGVINTHRMLCANAAQIVQVFTFLREEPPVMVDWLTWHHTYGGNKILGLTLHTGGTLYIDGGRATPQGVRETVRNLSEVSPTVYFSIPRGFLELMPYLEGDAELRRSFFARLRLIFYAAASLPQPVWDALEALSVLETGERVVITSGLGCTESAPSALMAHKAGGHAGLLGVPVPGLEVKLVPDGAKLEVRYRGPNITPGYWRDEAASAAAFDHEGYYRTGDALKMVDPQSGDAGLLFDGRIAEDFKLNTGTWVSVGTLRAAVTEAGTPLIHDVVVTGHDQPYVGALVFLNFASARKLAGLPGDAPEDEVRGHPAIRVTLQAALERLSAQATGSANHVRRLLIADFTPGLDVGEITDKGSLNQRGLLSRHPELVAELHAETPSPRTFTLSHEVNA